MYDINSARRYARLGKICWWIGVVTGGLAWGGSLGSIKILGSILAITSIVTMLATAYFINCSMLALGRRGWTWALGSFVFPIIFWYGYYKVKNAGSEKKKIQVDATLWHPGTECSKCGWPTDKPYAPWYSGTLIEWITTDDWDYICPKCGKVNVGYR